ncbi:6-phosphogluconate dehydrogenase [Labrys miyagiensis]|uniref:6-phosphogluconate dehydrogenase n=1 Tax=Labrys miyagiensis TaxID=346912 RepID=A0ABQ6CDL3_9HYPH|nr:NAD(P)-dependent oxidoreductase [Labrys miyagiensis]GLS18346.1 6-phosphogluconate dehydrogenase [Labrys miyagiensis]
MFREIAIIAPGAMGSAVARRLLEHGIRVTTLLEGRSVESRRRADDAGMIGVEPTRLVEADIIFSIVPPAQALPLAETIAPLLRQSHRKPIFVDCNAVSVETVTRVAGVIEASGAPFADAGIIGGPPVPGGAGPTFYMSGTPALELDALNDVGLQTVVMEGPIGTASALKMSYAGITKGLTGIAAAMILAAVRGGAAASLHKELGLSQAQLLQRFGKSLPDMYPKAYRWVAEMREIAAFAGDDPASARLYQALADFYETIADDYEGPQANTQAIDDFLRLKD